MVFKQGTPVLGFTTCKACFLTFSHQITRTIHPNTALTSELVSGMFLLNSQALLTRHSFESPCQWPSILNEMEQQLWIQLGWQCIDLACRKPQVQSLVPYNTKPCRKHVPFPQHLEGGSKRYQVNLSHMNNLKTASLGFFMGFYRRGKHGWKRKGKREGRTML